MVSSARYGRGARILSVGIASTGVVTFAYFSVACHVLDEVDYKGISLLWSVLFVIVSVIYRPVEQLLSRTIATRRARGHERAPAAHAAADPGELRRSPSSSSRSRCAEPINDDVFDGSTALYWVLVVAVLAYAASYFARGWLAGHQRFGLYGGLVFLEACSRFLFALAVAVGHRHGPGRRRAGHGRRALVSLVVVPWALRSADGAAREARARRRCARAPASRSRCS